MFWEDWMTSWNSMMSCSVPQPGKASWCFLTVINLANLSYRLFHGFHQKHCELHRQQWWPCRCIIPQQLVVFTTFLFSTLSSLQLSPPPLSPLVFLTSLTSLCSCDQLWALTWKRCCCVIAVVGDCYIIVSLSSVLLTDDGDSAHQ